MNANVASSAAPSTMAILDPTTLLWSEPKLKDPNIPKLAHHSATEMYQHMLVAFGKLTYSKKNLQYSNIQHNLVSFSSFFLF